MEVFERILSVSMEDIEVELRGHTAVPWADYYLNPRRLRGSDFLMRWSQGVWSEERIAQAVNRTGDYFALAYGPSGAAPDDDPREFELYFDRLETAGLGQIKRPDLLIFRATDKDSVNRTVERLGGVEELPFTPEDNPLMQELLSKAIVAIECENSLWRAKKMPDYNAKLTPQRRLDKKMGLKKSAVLPTVIIKEEDRTPLRNWQEQTGVKIHVWHVFYDEAYGISFDYAEELIDSGLIEPTVQTFQAPGGATTKKAIYKFYRHYAYPLGDAKREPKLIPAHIEDKNGHILPYVKFEGGSLELKPEALKLLDAMASGEALGVIPL